jgi:hypothetical protein
MASLNARCIRGPVGYDLSSAARVTIKFEQLQILGDTLLFIKTQNPAPLLQFVTMHLNPALNRPTYELNCIPYFAHSGLTAGNFCQLSLGRIY